MGSDSDFLELEIEGRRQGEGAARKRGREEGGEGGIREKGGRAGVRGER